MEFLVVVAFGFLGGLILNIMPCVFPVLIFKVSSWIEQADDDSASRRLDSLAFLAGCIVCFSAFAAAVIALRSGGRTIGWGMHMQNPSFVAVLIVLLVGFGLNCAGLFEITFSAGGGRKLPGWVGSFVDGVLITLIATPCSAPFLGTAAAAALASDATWYETVFLFWSVGAGLAFPVLLIGFIPACNRLLPRPGAWMESFKTLVGFTLLGAAVWLFGVLQKQLTAASANDFLWFLLLLSFALWIHGRWGAIHRSGRSRAYAALGGLAIIGAAHFVFVDFVQPPLSTAVGVVTEARTSEEKLVWVNYDAEVVAAASAGGQLVFLDFTADWCASCKTFEKANINTAATRRVFVETDTLTVMVDLTKENDALWEFLATFGRSALPAYVILMPDGSHDLLPEGAPISLHKRLRGAAEKFPPKRAAPL
jgi:thiol:disulfide interchange protein DsbD